MVITVVTSENNNSSIQYIRWPKRWPVEHSVVADSCPDVKNNGKDGFQQDFIDDFHLPLKAEGKTAHHVVSYLHYGANTIKGDNDAANCKGSEESLLKECFVCLHSLTRSILPRT